MINKRKLIGSTKVTDNRKQIYEKISSDGRKAKISNIPIYLLLHNGYIDDLYVLLRLLLVYPRIFNLVYDVQPLNRPAEYGMLVVEPRL